MIVFVSPKDNIHHFIYLSNIYDDKLNRGIWKRLEEQVRKFALQEGEIMVVTGPVLPKEKSTTIGNNKVMVPDRYYKVVYDLTPPQKMIGFIIPNCGSSRPLQDFAVTVDAVEKENSGSFRKEFRYPCIHQR